jgi:hypothetical protein
MLPTPSPEAAPPAAAVSFSFLPGLFIALVVVVGVVAVLAFFREKDLDRER